MVDETEKLHKIDQNCSVAATEAVILHHTHDHVIVSKPTLKTGGLSGAKRHLVANMA